MIVYRIGYHNQLIEEIEVEKMTDKSVFFKDGRITSKESTIFNYFHTLQEAKEYLEAKKHLKAKYTLSISKLEKQLQNLKNKLEDLKKY